MLAESGDSKATEQNVVAVCPYLWVECRDAFQGCRGSLEASAVSGLLALRRRHSSQRADRQRDASTARTIGFLPGFAPGRRPRPADRRSPPGARCRLRATNGRKRLIGLRLAEATESTAVANWQTWLGVDANVESLQNVAEDPRTVTNDTMLGAAWTMFDRNELGTLRDELKDRKSWRATTNVGAN